MIIRAILIWVLMALGEVLNGNIRVKYFQSRYGLRRAKQISFFSGTAIFATIIWFFLSWVGPDNTYQSFLVGFLWTLLMVFLDIFFGKYVFRYSWAKILEDFNPLKGNLLGVGLLLLLFAPVIVFTLQN